MDKELTYMQTKIAILDGGSSAKNKGPELILTVKQEQSWLASGKTTILSREDGSSQMEHTTKDHSVTTNPMDKESGISSMEMKSEAATNKQWFQMKIPMTKKSTSNWIIKAMLASLNQPGKSMLMKSSDNLQSSS